MESKDERNARLRLEARVARVEGELRTLKACIERRAREIRRVDDRLPDANDPIRQR